MPRASVIVCTRYRSGSLAQCLASLAAVDSADTEVVVVDNTPGDPETERVTIEAGARYLIEAREGLSRARNAGIEAATGDLIAFIDDDAVADPAWLRLHSEVLSDSSLVASTGRILPAVAGNGQGWLDLGERPFVVDSGDPWWFERANFGGVGSGGSNMVLKREAFDQGLRFRETLGLGADIGGFEEHYLFFTMIRNGARVAYVPSAIVQHVGAELAGNEESPRGARSYRYNAAYLTLLWVEEPEFRPRTLRYALQAFRGQQLPWRHRLPPGRMKMLAAGWRGSLLYLHSRLTRR